MGAEALKNALNSILQGWLSDHPVLGWCVTHPLWAIALVFLLVFLTWGLLKAIARLVETVWLVLLQSPIRFGRWMLRQVMRQFRLGKTEAEPETDPDLPLSRLMPQTVSQEDAALAHQVAYQADPAVQAALSSVVVRLEQLQKDQLQLLQDVQALLHPLSADPASQSAVTPPQPRLDPNQAAELVDRS